MVDIDQCYPLFGRRRRHHHQKQQHYYYYYYDCDCQNNYDSHYNRCNCCKCRRHCCRSCSVNRRVQLAELLSSKPSERSSITSAGAFANAVVLAFAFVFAVGSLLVTSVVLFSDRQSGVKWCCPCVTSFYLIPLKSSSSLFF